MNQTVHKEPTKSPESVFSTETVSSDGFTRPSARPPFTPLSPEKLSSLLPDYDNIQFLGRGGMGAVYKAGRKS